MCLLAFSELYHEFLKGSGRRNEQMGMPQVTDCSSHPDPSLLYAAHKSIGVWESKLLKVIKKQLLK